MKQITGEAKEDGRENHGDDEKYGGNKETNPKNSKINGFARFDAHNWRSRV